MKVIKRDGRAVDYNRDKIATAIDKANQEVRQSQRANKEQIKEITKYIEDLGKKRILVEDIQDTIEEKLMEIEKYELAKKYIVYRYTRALVRKQNTTDESILGLIRNENKQLNEENKNTMLASNQRDYIAGEVSRDLTRRILLPEKISKAHEDGVIYFHNADYFVQPVFNSSIINIGDMLDNGTVLNGTLIETPKSFEVACIVTTQIIADIASNQYGGQSIEIKHLGKYLRKSKNKLKNEIESKYKNKISQNVIDELIEQGLKKELSSGIQTIQYQINTIKSINGQNPSITLFLNLEKNDLYIEENAIIIKEILEQRYTGIKDENSIIVTPSTPKLVYVLDEHNCLKGGKYDYLTRLAIKCSSKRGYPDYISAKKLRQNYEGNVFSPIGDLGFLCPWKDENGRYKFEGRFNQGVVSINLPQIAIIADGNESEFWKLLDERLEICYEALMCRHYALLGTTADTSPINWRYGAIARLEKGEKIDKLLQGGYSTISLGYVGIYETTRLIKGVSQTTPEGHKFAIKVIGKLRETAEKWKKQTEIGFTLCDTPAENICHIFAQIDKEKFGVIKDVTDKGFYTNSYYIDKIENDDIVKRLTLESEFESLSLSGTKLWMPKENLKNNTEKIEKLIKFIYDNIQYISFYRDANILNDYIN